MGRVRIRRASTISITTVIALSLLCVAFFIMGRTQFNAVQETSDTYIACETAARQLQTASDYLTEQARLAVVTGEEKYVDAYFTEINTTKRRDAALDQFKEHFDGTEALSALNAAMERSDTLAETEEYAMRLMLESGISSSNSTTKARAGKPETWPQEIKDVKLSAEDAKASAKEKSAKAQSLLFSVNYESAKAGISTSIANCTNTLVGQTQNNQSHAETAFSDIYHKIELLVALFALIAIGFCLATRRLIVTPLLQFVAAVKRDNPFPITGAAELQSLAETYNKVYEESKERQQLIRHQAEHDALTGLLNRGSYDRLLELSQKEAADEPFALILCDVDTFKQVNDTYGHKMGDRILQRVSHLLETAFRDIDHICRLGGDEFAVIMVKMTPELAYTIEEKVNFINEELLHPTDDLPAVSLSVGVAFSSEASKSEDLFRNADASLYETKNKGRCGLTFHEDL